MSKLFIFNMVSLDGFFEGPDHQLDWHNVDEEFNDFAIEQLHQTGTILFGRVTYQMMSSFWSTDMAKKNDPVVAGLMNNMPKLVASKTLTKLEWKNTRLIADNLEDEVKSLKEHSQNSIAIFGSSNLCVSLLRANLIDEVRLMVAPVILGSGVTMFTGLNNKLDLQLVGSRQFKSGNVLLTYTPGYL